MIRNKKDAILYITNISGRTQFNRDGLQASVEVLQAASADEGLNDEEMDQLVTFLTNFNLASPLYCSLFSCLIPETEVSKKILNNLLMWYFSEAGNGKITSTVEKKFMQWLIGIAYYELADLDVINSYYYSFLFLLNKTYLEAAVSSLLYLISKPEDARRWVVQQILHIQNIGGPKLHTNTLLGLLKSYCPEVVPERVAISNFFYKNSSFDDLLKKAHLRKLERRLQHESSVGSDGLQWDIWKIYYEKDKRLTRLIPSVGGINSDCRSKEKKHKSMGEFKSMVSLGAELHRIQSPSQSLSLLTNTAGYHVLAFSGNVTKTRFSHKLYRTLFKVFLLELQPYSYKEKVNFLNSIRGLQEYTQQNFPVVTTFLYNYLLVWSGDEYQEEIFGLIEWLEIKEEEELEKYVFPQLRQIFISSGIRIKCLIIETMAKLMSNLLVMDKREKNYFRNHFKDVNITKCVEAIGGFVSDLIVNGLLWNNEKNTRNILMASLSFYETSQAVEHAGDLPVIIMMPPVLVYACLFSGSRVCLARLCSLLVSLQVNSVERLHLLGVFQDFAPDVRRLSIYILDCYRCLWSTVNFMKNEESFIFHNSSFCKIFWDFKENYGDLMEKIFGIEYNLSFFNSQSKGIHEVIMTQLSEEYPSVLQLKRVVEERLIQVE